MNYQLEKGAFRLTSAPGGPFWEFYKTPCPICGKMGNCMIHNSQEKICCTRVESKFIYGRNSSNPSFIHFLKEKKYILPKAEQLTTHKKKEDKDLQHFYEKLIDFLPLHNEHLEHLQKVRCLSKSEIHTRQYRSFLKQQFKFNGNDYSSIWNELLEDMQYDSWKGIPGFYGKKVTNGETYPVLSGFPGIMIPFRNQYNQITGWQIRVDEVRNILQVKDAPKGFQAKLVEQPNKIACYRNGNCIYEGNIEIGSDTVLEKADTKAILKISRGQKYLWLSSANKPDGTGSGAPIHISVPTDKLKDWKSGTLLQEKVVWVTEGPLKADITADYIPKLYDKQELFDVGTTVIAVPGVAAWKPVLPILAEMGVVKVNLAYDTDMMGNEKVKAQVVSFVTELKSLGYQVNIVAWSPEHGKGIDELMQARYYPKFLPV